jgi:transcription elongation factor GreA
MSDNTANQIKKIELTQEGFEELKAELKQLTTVKLPEAVERVALAREYGDLSENSEYQNARDDKDLIEARIAEIEKVLEKATIVQATRSTQRVGMGSHVSISMKGKKAGKRDIEIVGEYQANPAEGKISNVSPLGKALMGKKKGDDVVVKAPAGEIIYTIDNIK